MENTAASGEAPVSNTVSNLLPPALSPAPAKEDEELPAWLPDGWMMEVRITESGKKYRYYTSPVSGYTFCTRREVSHYLNVVKVDGDESDTTSSFGDEEPKLLAQDNHSPEWLPAGWILEIKTRSSGEKAGQRYKCYYDPVTESRFYSKHDVFDFLKSGEVCTPASRQKNFKKCLDANATDNVLAQIVYSPDGLPPGWIKELKYRKSKHNQLRKDPYYTDPVRGYVFRTLKDAVHYVETGEISKHAIKSRKRSIKDMYSVGRESPPPVPLNELESQGSAPRRCLYLGQTPENGEVIENDESPTKLQLLPLDHASYQSLEGAGPICSSSDIEETEGMAKRRDMAVERRKRGRPRKKLPEKGRPKKSFPKLLDSETVVEKPSDPSTEILAHLTGNRSLESEENLLEAGNKKPYLSDEKQTGVTPYMLMIENPGEHENVKHLNAKNEKANTEESELSKSSSKKPLEQEEKLLEPENKMSHTEEHMDAIPEVMIIDNPLEQEILKNWEPKSGKPKAEESTLVEPASKKPLEPQEKLFLEPDTEKSSRLIQKQTCPDQGVKKPGSSKTSAKKALHPPRRASKRLAGIKPFVTGLKTDRRPRRSMSTGKCSEIEISLSCREPESKESIGQTVLGDKSWVSRKPADDKLGGPTALPFGDSWSDPCIEFAVKTLTGDIPVLEDGTIQEYLHQQLISVESLSPSAPALLAFDRKEEFKQANADAQLETPEKHNLPVSNKRRAFPEKRKVSSGATLNQGQRRSARLN